MDSTQVEVLLRPEFHRSLIRSVAPQMAQLRADIETDMIRLVEVDTGHLRDTIFCTLDVDTGEIVGVATADYARKMEFGWPTPNKFVEPTPFVRPAFYKRRGAYR